MQYPRSTPLPGLRSPAASADRRRSCSRHFPGPGIDSAGASGRGGGVRRRMRRRPRSATAAPNGRRRAPRLQQRRAARLRHWRSAAGRHRAVKPPTARFSQPTTQRRRFWSTRRRSLTSPSPICSANGARAGGDRPGQRTRRFAPRHVNQAVGAGGLLRAHPRRPVDDLPSAAESQLMAPQSGARRARPYPATRRRLRAAPWSIPGSRRRERHHAVAGPGLHAGPPRCRGSWAQGRPSTFGNPRPGSRYARVPDAPDHVAVSSSRRPWRCSALSVGLFAT